MFKVLTKREIAFFFLLVGILIGMLTNVFLGYSIDARKAENMLYYACKNNNPEKINIYLFGKYVSIKCESGEIKRYNLITQDKVGAQQE